MKFEMITSKSVLGADEAPVSLHKAGCGGAKREAKKCYASIFPIKAETLEAAKQEAFVEGGLEECGYVVADLDVHSCCLKEPKAKAQWGSIEEALEHEKNCGGGC